MPFLLSQGASGTMPAALFAGARVEALSLAPEVHEVPGGPGLVDAVASMFGATAPLGIFYFKEALASEKAPLLLRPPGAPVDGGER
eukprot:1910342-Pyramimonas_sp.AAC.1